MASVIYSKALKEIKKEGRFVGKTTILGAGYGIGPQTFQTQLKAFCTEIAESESRHIIEVYRRTYPLILVGS